MYHGVFPSLMRKLQKEVRMKGRKSKLKAGRREEGWKECHRLQKFVIHDACTQYMNTYRCIALQLSLCVLNNSLTAEFII